MYFSSLSFFSSLELSGEKTLLQNLLFNPLACGTCLHLTKLLVPSNNASAIVDKLPFFSPVS